MSGKDAKLLRKQIKNVIQEIGRDLLVGEVGNLVMKNVLAELNRRLDRIESYVTESITKIDKRTKAVQGFLVGTVKNEIQNEVYNASVTIDSLIEVLAESNLVVPELAAKIDAKKKEIDARRQKQAEEKMKAALQAKAEEPKEQPAAVENAPVEQKPAEQLA